MGQNGSILRWEETGKFFQIELPNNLILACDPSNLYPKPGFYFKFLVSKPNMGKMRNQIIMIAYVKLQALNEESKQAFQAPVEDTQVLFHILALKLSFF